MRHLIERLIGRFLNWIYGDPFNPEPNREDEGDDQP
jgi:hypothetical protein